MSVTKRANIFVLQVDTLFALLGFAVTINSAILILASAAFYYGGDEAVRAAGADADLFSAHGLIMQQISKGGRSIDNNLVKVCALIGIRVTAAALIFALALLCVSHPYSLRPNSS